MAAPAPISLGVDTTAIQAAANQAAYNFAVVAMWTMLIALIGGMIFWYLYKKSFNVGITVLDNTKGKNVGLIRNDLIGKLYQVRPGEFRFKIFKAKKHKIRYNQEHISPGDFYNERTKNGKIKSHLFMTYDDEGQLIPTRFDSIIQRRNMTDEKGKIILDADGKPKTYDTGNIQAIVDPVDIAWFFKELDKSAEMFDARTAFDKWGWIIICVCFILLLGGFIFCAYKFNTAAASLADAAVSIARAQAIASSNSTLVSGALAG